MSEGEVADVAELLEDVQLFGQDFNGVVQLSTRLKNVGDLGLGDGAASAIVQRRECLPCARVGGFRFCHVAERPLHVAQIEQQVHVSRTQRGPGCQILLQSLDAHLSVGCVDCRTLEVRLRQVGTRCRWRQREVKHPGTPIPKVRRAPRDRLQVAGQHPEQHWASAPLRKRLPALIEAAQQIIETLGPGFKTHELRRPVVWIHGQAIEENLRSNAFLRIDDNPHVGVQSPFQKAGDFVTIDAVRVGEKAQCERRPAFHQAL